MSYSWSASRTYFTAGETAPPPEQVLAGAPIPNDTGSWALTELSTVESDPSSMMELDTSTEPPTLRLKNVGAVGVWGEVIDNQFVERAGSNVAGHWVISGDYVGPNSRLEA